jgi:3-methyladenine DNA glycosylase AlkD
MTATASPTTEKARAFVEARQADAVALGRSAGDLVQDPSATASALRRGLTDLADPEYHAGQARVAPGIGPQLGVRQPLLTAVGRGLKTATTRDRAATLLDVAAALFHEPEAELHWLAIDLLERVVADAPEQAWQLLRAEARRAGEWITVDRLARPAGRGILAEPYRWAELEQLVYSPSRWERRLAASTVATIPHLHRTAGRTPEIADHGRAIVDELIGDAEPDVQKALSWALRTLSVIDNRATVDYLRRQATVARETHDGHRAWVVRDSLEKLDPATAAGLREAVAGIRRRPGAPPTSRASATAADFLGLGLAVPPAERPVIDRP